MKGMIALDVNGFVGVKKKKKTRQIFYLPKRGKVREKRKKKKKEKRREHLEYSIKKEKSIFRQKGKTGKGEKKKKKKEVSGFPGQPFLARATFEKK